MSADLTQIVLRAQQGDPSAFSELYENTYNSAYFLIRRWLGDDAENEALDVLQESYIEIFKTIDKLRNPEAVKSWISKIAYHQCTKYFRNKPDTVTVDGDESESYIGSVPDSNEEFLPQEALENNELRKHIEESVNRLPLDQKTVTLLYYYDQLSVSEIAGVVNCPEGTVKSRLRLSRDRLRAAVENFVQKGARYYALASLPILTQILQDSSKDFVLTAEQSRNIFIAAAEGAGLAAAAIAAGASIGSSSSASAAGSAAGASSAGSSAPLSVIIAVSAVTLTVGAAAAGIIIANNSKKDTPEETEPDTSYSQSDTQSDTRVTEIESDSIIVTDPVTNEAVTLTTVPDEPTMSYENKTEPVTEPATEKPAAVTESTTGAATTTTSKVAFEETTTAPVTEASTTRPAVTTSREETTTVKPDESADPSEEDETITAEYSTLIDPFYPIIP